VYRPFNQTILLPKSYEGIVIIEYGQEDGQEEKRMGSFLGMGGSRIIQTDKNGYVKTQVKYFNKHIPILDVGGPSTDLENMKIYYEDNLNNEIPKYQGPTPDYTNDLYEQRKKNNLPVAYTTHGSTERNIFVVCKVKDYYKYFYTEREIQEINKKGECYQPDWENKLRNEYINKINQQQICP
jgi:hypothetical protein